MRTISVGQAHNAIPLTGALCLAAAIRTEGTIANKRSLAGAGPIRIGHPSGTISVDADTSCDVGGMLVRHATVLRTARRLFEGQVIYEI
ncbi:PrpF domain-containing protein [Paracoccus indicus]|uniref:PrpF domain-containing protein n=1 Tax=Paracoccus indicus TaxID=2079229 RepID=UPI0013B3E677